MHSSVWAPDTTSLPIPADARTSSRSVSSNESAYFLWTTGSESCGESSGTIPHSSLPRARCSEECCTQTTGTPASRALSTSPPMFRTTRSRS